MPEEPKYDLDLRARFLTFFLHRMYSAIILCYGEIALSRDFRFLGLLGFNAEDFLCLLLCALDYSH